MVYLTFMITFLGSFIWISLGGIKDELKRSNDLKEKELNKNNNPNQPL